MTLATISRSRKPLIVALVAFTFLVLLSAQSARADITPTPTSTSGTTDASTGGHGNLTVGATFAYSATSEDLKQVVVDTPAGGVGNPNAVPYADRCPIDQFKTATCAAASQVGTVKLSVTATWGAIQIPLDLTGTVSIIQQSPEVPTLVGAYIVPPGGLGDPIRAYATYSPVTSGPDGDFRIRSVTSEFPRTAATILGTLPIQVNSYEQTLFGILGNGNAFITNPTRCDTWLSYGYALAYDHHDNGDSDPLQTGSNDFKRTAAVETTPNCDTPAELNTTASASVSTGARETSPTFTTDVTIPGLGRATQGPAIPKSIVATLPKALNVDVQQLGRVCTNDQFAVNQCPPTTQVGSVHIDTPMITAGLDGEAYLTQASPGGTLPDLGIHVHGAIDFQIRGVNHYVNTSALQSTFDNIPQVGFSKFSLSLSGGTNGLLKTLKCPTTATPADGGPVHFDITSYQGQTAAIDSPISFDGCFKVTVKRVNKCVKSRLKLSTVYASRSMIRYVKLSIKGQKTKTIKKSPFRVNVALGKKVKKGKSHRYALRVYYKPVPPETKGKIVLKTGKFKRCA